MAYFRAAEIMGTQYIIKVIMYCVPIISIICCVPIMSALAQAPHRAPHPGGPLAAQLQGDAVVATVDGEQIMRSEVMGSFTQAATQMPGMSSMDAYRMVLDRLIDSRLIDRQASRDKVRDDPEFAQSLKELERRLAQQFFLNRYLADKVTEATLRASHAAAFPDGKGERKVRARHILVSNEADAKAVIGELRAGGDFAKVAKSKSIDPLAEQGGDLGFFAFKDMVPAFSEAAFAMAKGEVSKLPVKTQFGWHVIKVEDEQSEPAIPFEQARERLEQESGQAAIIALIEELRGKSAIERFNMDGTPLAGEPKREPQQRR
ncbi:MAG: peptidylprolyl isomerase [Alphaproteobacteria bacterium]|nr:peptidylprolyl isomerase [Alphaproteobacteria bacterium]